jgi:hypothetical protein
MPELFGLGPSRRVSGPDKYFLMPLFGPFKYKVRLEEIQSSNAFGLGVPPYGYDHMQELIFSPDLPDFDKKMITEYFRRCLLDCEGKYENCDDEVNFRGVLPDELPVKRKKRKR